MLGEIIVVETQQAISIVNESNPSRGRVSATWKQLNEFHFAALWSIISGSSDSSDFESKLTILTADGGEVWVVVIPNELTELLFQRQNLDNSKIVNDWFLIEEFKWGWSKESVLSLFNDLVRLAVIAKKNNSSLVYWGKL